MRHTITRFFLLRSDLKLFAGGSGLTQLEDNLAKRGYLGVIFRLMLTAIGNSSFVILCRLIRFLFPLAAIRSSLNTDNRRLTRYFLLNDLGDGLGKLVQELL